MQGRKLRIMTHNDVTMCRLVSSKFKKTSNCRPFAIVQGDHTNKSACEMNWSAPNANKICKAYILTFIVGVVGVLLRPTGAQIGQVRHRCLLLFLNDEKMWQQRSSASIKPAGLERFIIKKQRRGLNIF